MKKSVSILVLSVLSMLTIWFNQSLISQAEAVTGVKIEQEYAKEGVPLTAVLENAPDEMVCTYQWAVDGVNVAAGNSYTPKKSDLEKNITVTATVTSKTVGSYQASIYFSKLPVVYINTEDGQAVTDKVNYKTADLKIQGNESAHTAEQLYDGGISIKGRGNSTWGYAKKPYKIKLDTKTNIFGFGKNKHWVLLANYTDESHLRNALSYNLSGSMGMPYMKSKHVVLILNGEYQGLYQFCEHVRISDTRVNIQDWDSYGEDAAKAIYKAEKANGMKSADQDKLIVQMTEQDLTWITSGQVTYGGKTYFLADYITDVKAPTGGFLLELDEYYDEISKFKTSHNQPINFNSPEFIYTNPELMTSVKNYLNAFEAAIDTYDFTTIYNGKAVSYSQLFDMDSMVGFWLVSELFMNVDAMKKSTYLYQDVGGLFHMGPVWDMDWSSNSLVSRWEGSGTVNEWQTKKFSGSAQAKQWYKSIIKDPYFAVQAFEAYRTIRSELGGMAEQEGTIDNQYSYLLEAANKNAMKWYTSDNERAFHNQVNTLKTYLSQRLDWLDSQFASPETLLMSLGAYTPQSGISVDKADMTRTAEGLSIPVKVTDAKASKVELRINGKAAGVTPVSDGTAVFELSGEWIAKEINALQTVQVFGLSSAGAVITQDGAYMTDYAVFLMDDIVQQERPEEPEQPEQPVPSSAVASISLNEKTKVIGKGKTFKIVSTVLPGKADQTVRYQSDNEKVAVVSADGIVKGIKKGKANITVYAGTKSAACEVTVSEVSLNVNKLTMQVKQKTDLIKVSAKYPKTDTISSWKSSQSKVAVISSKGVITAKTPGKTQITVTMKSGATASFSLQVIKGKVKTTGLRLDKTAIQLKKGKTHQIKVSREPLTANDKVIYTSDNKKAVKVNSSGKITGLKKGKAVITVKAGKKTARIKVTVK